MSPEILAVVVLHKQTLAESATVTSLEQSFAAFPDLHAAVHVMLWDNSPEPLNDTSTRFLSTYHHSRVNVGLSRAYNTAAGFAQQRGIPWLLLLDQDTSLPATFLPAMLTQARELASRSEIAAIVPIVFVGAHQASPVRLFFNRQRPYPPDESGPAPGEALAINSGSLLRVESLLRAGGYSEAFWLDYSDWYVCHQLHRHGMQIWRAAHIRMEHSMTILDYENLMSLWRYRNFLHAEGAFHDLFRGRLENATQTLRLFARVARQRKRLKNPEFARITLRYARWRLFTGRRGRLRVWEKAADERRAQLEAGA